MSIRAPEELEGNALLAWTKYVKELAILGSVSKLDRAGLITLCRATALKEEAARNLETTGTVITLPNSYPGPSPYLKVFFEAAKLEKAWLMLFGLTRTTRAKATTPEPEHADEELNF